MTRLRPRRSPLLPGFIALLVLSVVACDSGAPVVSSASPTPSGPRPAAQLLTPQGTPGPVMIPVDDGPHDVLTEWWYFTGHLAANDGKQYGFEFVIFQGNRAGFAPEYAAHFAITDVADGSFHYDQRTQSGGQTSPTSTIDLKLGDWSLTGSGPRDQIVASMPGYALTLTVDAQKPPALHGENGYLNWAPATGSYYYSRTRMAVTGTLTVNGAGTPVSGEAWMDHQWGNFLLFGGGGWNWYSIQLSDGDDIMLWQSQDSRNNLIFGSGTYVDRTGAASLLTFSDFTVKPVGTWTSPHSGATYPSGWTVEISSKQLSLTVEPVLEDQELDTRKSTGVIYWEGEVRVSGSENGRAVTGEGYVELTGYAATAVKP